MSLVFQLLHSYNILFRVKSLYRLAKLLAFWTTGTVLIQLYIPGTVPGLCSCLLKLHWLNKLADECYSLSCAFFEASSLTWSALFIYIAYFL